MKLFIAIYIYTCVYVSVSNHTYRMNISIFYVKIWKLRPGSGLVGEYIVVDMRGPARIYRRGGYPSGKL